MIRADDDDLAASLDVSRETLVRLRHFQDMLLLENQRQNLVSKGTVADFFNRHIVDCAQLGRLAPTNAALWLDVGAGAGLPGVVNALMTQADHWLVEPRRLRAKFLREVVEQLELGDRVVVRQCKVEAVRGQAFSVITARAFASLTGTINATLHLADQRTTWLLHKGRTVAAELLEAKRTIAADFELIPSITDPEAAIVKVTNLHGSRP